MPVQSKPIKHMMPESDEQVQREVEERTGTRPCIWQIQVVQKVLEGCDVITIAATGSGKTFTYWMLLCCAMCISTKSIQYFIKQFFVHCINNDDKAAPRTK